MVLKFSLSPCGFQSGPLSVTSLVSWYRAADVYVFVRGAFIGSFLDGSSFRLGNL